MIRAAVKRVRGYLMSVALHVVLIAVLLTPWSSWFAGGGSTVRATESSHYVPLQGPPDHPPGGEPDCRQAPCTGERRRPKGVQEPPAPQGEELEFLDDTSHALMAALRRAGGWVAVVSRSDRWHSLAFYRAGDGTDLGAGLEIARYPLRVVVHEPESYPEIEAWLATLGPAPESFRVIAIFPPQTQQLLHAAIEAQAKRAGLPAGPRRAVVAISAADPTGITVRSVIQRPEIDQQGGG